MRVAQRQHRVVAMLGGLADRLHHVVPRLNVGKVQEQQAVSRGEEARIAGRHVTDLSRDCRSLAVWVRTNGLPTGRADSP